MVLRVVLLGTLLWKPGPPPPAGSESVNRDPFLTLGVRASAPHFVGASLAAAGLLAWTISRDAKSARVLTIGPRLYCAGGGLGFVLRW